LKRRFIVVAGVGTLTVENWKNKLETLWLTEIKQPSTDDIGIFSFPNQLASSGTLLSRGIENEGAAFLDDLQRLADDQTARRNLPRHSKHAS